MVKRFILLLLVLCSALSAGEFTAAVRNKKVPISKGFPLTLTLRDTTATGIPDISELAGDFTIHSQQQSSSTIVTNGKLSTSTSWKYTLIPSKEGQYTIPAISIETKEGTLWSQPIIIDIVKPKASAEDTEHRDGGFIVTTKASKTTPYKNEPISYLVRLTAKDPFDNVRMEKMEIENAIVEMVQKPNGYSKVINGIKVYILEYPVLITPLKEGTMIIPSAMIQGETPIKERSRSPSFFDDGFDPFGIMSRFGRMEPFAIKTDETVLNVQPPVPGIVPWLPASSLKIEEQWDESQKQQVGEPLTLNVRVSAVGLRAAQLPSLERAVESNDDFKIYADKPESGEDITADKIFSFRIEQYTIIPQKAGQITLPEISISWWDVDNDTKAIAKLPAKTLDIAPAEQAKHEVMLPGVATEKASPTTQVVVEESNPLLYGVIAGLAILLIFAFVWVFSLQKRIGRLSETSEKVVEISPEKKPVIRFKELQSVKTAKEFHEFLQKYSHDKWGTPENATVKAVCEEIRVHTPQQVHEDLIHVERSLENALYRDVDVDISDLSNKCSSILEGTRDFKETADKQEKLPELNPN